MNKFKPLNGFILVDKPLSEPTVGGVFLPDQVVERSLIATVLAVGGGVKTAKGETPVGVKEGDRVLLTKFTGQEMKIDGKDAVLIKEENIISVIR